MLFLTLSQMQVDPAGALVTFSTFSIALLMALTVHEFSHALVATNLGDPTARWQGRLSLNPRAHLDPLGTAMILVAGFGWAKPVPVRALYLRPGPRTGMAVVASAGPLSNVALATVFSIPLRTGLVPLAFEGFTTFHGGPGDIVGHVFAALVFWNLLLAVFNLIPLAPLDGFNVALGLLPEQMAHSFARLERHGPAILLLLILSTLILPGPGILFAIVSPIVNAAAYVLLSIHLL